MVTEELVRGFVRPMPVFQRQDDATSVSAAPDESEEGLPECLATGGPRCNGQRMVRVGWRQEMTKCRRVSLAIKLKLLADLKDFCDALPRARTRPKLQELIRQIDPRTIRRVDGRCRTATVQHCNLLARDASEKLMYEAAFAKARLCRDCNCLSMSRPRTLEALSQMREFEGPPHKFCQPAQQSALECRTFRIGAGYSIGRDWVGAALSKHGLKPLKI